MSETETQEAPAAPSTFHEVAAQQPQMLEHVSQHVNPATGKPFIVRYVREDLCTLKV